MELNQTGHPSCQVSHRTPFLIPCCFLCTSNDIMSDIESKIRLFADDCVCYREIKAVEDTLKLQKDVDHLGQEMWYEISTSQMQHDAADE